MSNRWFLPLLATGFAIGIVIGRTLASAPPPPLPPTAARVDAVDDTPSRHEPPVAATSAPTRREPSAVARATDKPLPTPDARIADHFAELSARAEAGDPAAARRLADDFAVCERHAGDLAAAEATLAIADQNRSGNTQHEARALASAERHLQTYRNDATRCAGFESLPGDSARWVALAARNGDPEALLCHSLFPSDWNQPLSPAWLAHAERAHVNAVDYARRAYAGGVPEAAALLSRMHQPPDGGLTSYATGRGGADPYWALAYAEVAAATLAGQRSELWRRNAAQLAAALPPERVAQARDWAQRQRERIDFRQLAESSGDTRSRCTTLRRMAGL